MFICVKVDSPFLCPLTVALLQGYTFYLGGFFSSPVEGSITICLTCQTVNFIYVKKSSPGWLAGSGVAMSEN